MGRDQEPPNGRLPGLIGSSWKPSRSQSEDRDEMRIAGLKTRTEEAVRNAECGSSKNFVVVHTLGTHRCGVLSRSPEVSWAGVNYRGEMTAKDNQEPFIAPARRNLGAYLMYGWIGCTEIIHP